MPNFFTCYCFLFSFFFSVASLAQPGTSTRNYTTQSVLNTSTWYKIGVTGSGLYKLDKMQLQALGISGSIDPRTIKLYGNGGQLLPQANNVPRPDDLIQNAIYVAGETDGRLDNEDYVLFFAPGPHQWNFDKTNGQFNHLTNIYSDTAYYFLTAGSGPGQRVTSRPALGNATQTITTYIDRQYHEKDLKNMLLSGREWYGELFNATNVSQEFNFLVPDRAPSGNVSITAALMSNAENATSFNLKVNNVAVGTHHFTGRGAHDYHEEGENINKTYQFNSNSLPLSGELKIFLTYNPNGNNAANGYLNYLKVIAERNLTLRGKQLFFRSLENISPNAKSAFIIANVPDGAVVWDVTNPLKPAAYPLQISNGSGRFVAPTDSLREFIVFTGSDFPKPFSLGVIENQNVHALNADGSLDFVIITHPLFKVQAERLARHRENKSGLKVAVVTTKQVYQEFSSGSQDVTALRDLMKMVYDRRKKKGDDILYLLLFGDASYDYKSVNTNGSARTPNNTNFVPVYESRESLNPLKTYSSDDYFGFLDDNEGHWSEENFSQAELVDIGIGRLPAKTVAEATLLVDKIIHYESPASFGKWRKKITFIADDGDGAEHLQDAENLVNYIESTTPAYQATKIYLDLFKQESVANGQRSPETNANIDKAIEQGSLITNYTGHGNETSLAHEQIITVPQLTGWQNLDRLTFMLTATCEFGRYDDPKRNSGAELALLNSKGGAIGMLTTTRPVYANSNRVLNRSFIQHALHPINDRMPRLGHLVRLTKNESYSQLNTRNFSLLGDPSMQLAYPELTASITHINNTPVTVVADTLKALSTVSLKGHISDINTNVASGFNGKMQVTVYEKQSIFKTRGDESVGSGNIRNVSIQENTLYEGEATVSNGFFTITFVVPKDISYHYAPGKISLYAFNAKTDAQGSYTNVMVGGSDKLAVPDNTPPTIRLYMNDETFLSGGLTNKNTTLIAHLFDEKGINTTATGIGHEITATLNGDKTNTVILNNYYSAQENNYKAGSLRYMFKDLSPGKHKLTLKAWDTHNNSGEATISFVVTDPAELKIEKLQNFPNPFRGKTAFTFEHSRAGQDLDIQIQLFSVTGKLVKTIITQRPQSKTIISDILWDGKDENGWELTNGLYNFRIVIRSNHDNAINVKYQKLLILK